MELKDLLPPVKYIYLLVLYLLAVFTIGDFFPNPVRKILATIAIPVFILIIIWVIVYIIAYIIEKSKK